MRAFAAVLLSIGLVASPVFAANDAKETAKEDLPVAPSSVTIPAAASKEAAKPESSAIENQLQDLRSLVETQTQELEEQRAALKTQQLKMEALEERLHASAVSEPATAVVTASSVPAATPAAAPAQAADANKAIDDRIGARVGPFTFSGDMRLRQEPFFGGPADRSQVRDRFRYRARLNINARLNPDWAGGITLATGDINNPVTANQTANQDYTRKPFYLDRAFVNYTPHQIKQLSVVGGKFAYPWLRTELTWDNDMNPEGGAETLNFNMPKTPVLKRFALVGFQLPFSETKGINGLNIPATNKSTALSVVYGGQVQSEWELASWVRLTADVAFYNWHNADPIALALQGYGLEGAQGANIGSSSAGPALGLLPLSVGTVSNTIQVWKLTTANANNITNTIVNAQFASRFALLDAIARLDIKTMSAKWPIILLGDYVQNTAACANVGNFFAPAGTTGSTSNLGSSAVAGTFTCNSRERRGYWLEGRAGRLANKGDFQIAYTRMFIEREAVMGAVNFDDMRTTSNVTQHRLEVFYNLEPKIRLGFTGLFGRPLNWGPNAAATTEPFLKRLQIDLLYTF